MDDKLKSSLGTNLTSSWGNIPSSNDVREDYNKQEKTPEKKIVTDGDLSNVDIEQLESAPVKKTPKKKEENKDFAPVKWETKKEEVLPMGFPPPVVENKEQVPVPPPVIIQPVVQSAHPMSQSVVIEHKEEKKNISPPVLTKAEVHVEPIKHEEKRHRHSFDEENLESPFNPSIEQGSNEILFRAYIDKQKRETSRLLNNKLDYTALAEELKNSKVKVSSGIMDIYQLNEAIEHHMMLRARVGEIYLIIIQDSGVRKKIRENLYEVGLGYAKGSSVDRRVAWVNKILSDYDFNAIESEYVYNMTKETIASLDTMYEMLSRRVTCTQEETREISRGATPYQNTNTVIKENKNGNGVSREYLDEIRKTPMKKEILSGSSGWDLIPSGVGE